MPAPLITIAQARHQILERISVPASELAPVAFALGRVLAAEVVAGAVIPQENVVVQDNTIETTSEVHEGDHVRASGEDMRAGTRILTAGTRLGAIELGAVVTAGLAEVSVTPRPHVAVLCTGDELRAPGEPLGPGEIHNSNALMLTGLAAGAGALTDAAERLRDDRGATRDGIGRALERAGVVIISGGVSVGPHDHVKPAWLAEGVTERFWRVALRPGKPTWFGTRGDSLVFGLPGNPVSAMVTFQLFVRPALAALQGADPAARRGTATLDAPVERNPRREQAVRVRLRADGDGWHASPTGPQGSHMLTSMLGADALARIAPGTGEVAAGERVEVELL